MAEVASLCGCKGGQEDFGQREVSMPSVAVLLALLVVVAGAAPDVAVQREQIDPPSNNSSHNRTLLGEERTIYNVSHFVLAGAYFVLTLVTLCLVGFKCATGSLSERWKQAFFLGVILGSAMRGCWAVFDPLVYDGVMLISNR